MLIYEDYVEEITYFYDLQLKKTLMKIEVDLADKLIYAYPAKHKQDSHESQERKGSTWNFIFTSDSNIDYIYRFKLDFDQLL